MRNLGYWSYYLEIEVLQKIREIYLKQSKYVNNILGSCRYPMEGKSELSTDEQGEPLGHTEYWSIMGRFVGFGV